MTPLNKLTVIVFSLVMGGFCYVLAYSITYELISAFRLAYEPIQ